MVSKNGRTPGLQPDNNTYLTQTGQIFTLQKVNPAMLQGLSNMESRPEPPLIEVTIAGKHKQWMTHYDSEGYQAALRAWQNKEGFLVMALTFCLGIEEEPPKTWIKDTLRFMPELEGNERDLKYRWVMSCLSDANESQEMADLMEAITGQTMPTQAGLEEAAASFPD